MRGRGIDFSKTSNRVVPGDRPERVPRLQFNHSSLDLRSQSPPLFADCTSAKGRAASLGFGGENGLPVVLRAHDGRAFESSFVVRKSFHTFECGRFPFADLFGFARPIHPQDCGKRRVGCRQPVGLLVRSRGILLDVDHQRPIRRNLLVR